MLTSFFGVQSLGYLAVCLLRGDAFFQIFGVWHSTEVLMWSSGILLLGPLFSGISHLLTAERRVAGRRNYSNDVLLKRWIGLQLDGLLPEDVVASRRIHIR